MKIIVTGGAGFIGSHIVDAYVRAGHRVVVIDNLSAGSRKNLNSRAIFYKADIRNLSQVEKIFSRERPEIVNHHAALIDVVNSVANPLPTLETNALGTATLLSVFKKFGKGKKKIIFASSAAVYGNPKSLPAHEAAECLPISAYGLSKVLAEKVIRFYGATSDIDHTIFRYSNAFGPRQKSGAISIFADLMRRGRTPVIFGDGRKNRDYIYVEDIVRANILALKKGKSETLNLGWGEPVSDKEAYDALAKNIGFKKSPFYKPYRQGEIYAMALSAKRARKIIGWEPVVKFEEGVKRTVRAL
jgi:UDP-glucose 4-epimerase